MDEDNDLVARLNILILNSLNLVERVEQMMENSHMCGDAALEENFNTEEEEEEQGDQNVDEAGDVGSEGWRTPPEDLVSARIIISTRIIFNQHHQHLFSHLGDVNYHQEEISSEGWSTPPETLG